MHPDHQRRIAFLPGAVSNLITAGGSRFYRETFDLGLGEARRLYVPGYETDLTAGRASQIVGIDTGATSRALAVLGCRMVRVTVDSADARQKVLRLTTSGRYLGNRLMALALERETRLISIFSAKEVELLSDLLNRLRVHLSKIRSPQDLRPDKRRSRSSRASSTSASRR